MDTSAAKQQAVLAALDHLTAQGGEVNMNISTVARAAGVSRQFVYTHEMLREAVANAADAVRNGQPCESTRHDVALGLRADRRVLAVKVERQAATIVELKALPVAVDDYLAATRNAQAATAASPGPAGPSNPW